MLFITIGEKNIKKKYLEFFKIDKMQRAETVSANTFRITIEQIQIWYNFFL